MKLREEQLPMIVACAGSTENKRTCIRHVLLVKAMNYVRVSSLPNEVLQPRVFEHELLSSLFLEAS